MPTRIEAVLFDAVGTLIAPSRPVGATYREVASRHAVEVAEEDLEAGFRATFPAMPPMAFPERALAERPAYERDWWKTLVRRTFERVCPGQTIESFDALFDELFHAFAQPAAWTLRAGARGSVEALRRAGRRCAVLSNFDHRLHAVLAGLAFLDPFEFVLLPTECGAAKPDPDIFAAALERLELPASAVVLVGDDPDDDHAGAQRAGIRAVDVRELATLAELPATLHALERASG